MAPALSVTAAIATMTIMNDGIDGKDKRSNNTKNMSTTNNNTQKSELGCIASSGNPGEGGSVNAVVFDHFRVHGATGVPTNRISYLVFFCVSLTLSQFQVVRSKHNVATGLQG